MREREREREAGVMRRRGNPGKRVQNAVAMLLLAASILSLGGFAFAAEPGVVDTGATDEIQTFVTDTPADTPSPSVVPSDDPAPVPSVDTQLSLASVIPTVVLDTPESTDTPEPTETPESMETSDITDESVLYVQALVDALPTAEEINALMTALASAENPSDEDLAALDTAAVQVEQARELYNALTPEQKAQIVNAERIAALAALLSGQGETLAEGDATAVHYFVAINAVWTEITPAGGSSTDGIANFNGTNRYYVTTAKLAEIYGGYGFNATDVNSGNVRIFPHNNVAGDAQIWADAAPAQIDGVWCVPLGDGNKTEHFVYYTPRNGQAGVTSSFTGAKDKSDLRLLTDNSFFTVEVDTTGLTEEEEGKVTVSASRMLSGGTVKVTVPKREGDAYWRVTDGNATIATPPSADGDNGTTVYTIGNIASEHVFTPGSGITIEYDARVEFEPTGDTNYTPHLTGSDGKVGGESVHRVSFTAQEEAHSLLGIDSDVVDAEIFVNENPKPAPVKYTFLGWKLADSDELITADSLTRTFISEHAADRTLKLKAVWTPFIQNANGDKYIASANFYVGRDIEIHGNEHDYVTIEPVYFTDSVFTTRVRGVPAGAVPSSGHNDIITRATDPTTANNNDRLIRELVYKGVDGITFADGMPSDEKVLEVLRNTTDEIKMAGKAISPEIRAKLTPDRFAIRWYVLKYVGSDGYHVDGLIVAKPGTLIVQKTFSGDRTTIDAVKSNFYISVEHNVEEFTGTEENNKTDVHKLDYKLVLEPDSASLGAGGGYSDTVGYSAYDPESDTYTWVFQGFQGVEYQVIEKGYEAPENEDNISCEASYKIVNKKGGGETAWTVYGNKPQGEKEGVVVEMAAYSDSTPNSMKQTVVLHNSYIKPGVITVVKTDELTSGVISGVEFTLGDENGTAISLYQKPNLPEYSTVADTEYTLGVTAAQTDTRGRFSLKLLPGDYILTETIPGGYYGAETTKFTVDDNNRITALTSHDVLSGAPDRGDRPWASVDESGTTVTLANVSRTFDVTVKNKWLNAQADEKKPIQLELLRGGVPLGEVYTVTQNPDAEYTWSDLPLFVNGRLAEYSVKVSKIGDTNYSDNIIGVTDGYEDYSVTHDNAVYTLTGQDKSHSAPYWHDDKDITKIHFADHLLLVVNISPVEGPLSIKKVMDSAGGYGLPGAEFGLYTDANCSAPAVKTIVSDESGVLSLKNIGAGEYYLKETKAPVGFATDTSVYKVLVTNGSATVTRYADADGKLVTGDDANYPISELVNETSLTLVVQNRTVEEGEAVLYGSKIKLEKIDGQTPELICRFDLTDNANTRIDKKENLVRGTYRITQETVDSRYNLYGAPYEFKVENGELIPVIQLMTLATYSRQPGWYPGLNADGSFLLTVYNEPPESTDPGGSDDPDDPNDPNDPDDPDDPDDSNPSPQPTVTPVPTTTPSPTWWYSPYGYTALPQTGQTNWPLPILIGLGVLLLAIGLAVSHKKKK